MKIHGSVLKVYRDLHSWVGICAGLLLFICFVAGSLTMFEPEINRWSQPQLQRFAPVDVVQYDVLLPQLLAQEPAAAADLTISLSSDAPAPFVWQQTPSRGFTLHNPQCFAGPDAGKLLQIRCEATSQLGQLIDLLHRTAGIPGLAGHHYVGEIVMGVAALLYFIALVSGLILLLPNLIRDFFTLRRDSAKKFWLDSHNLLGITSLPFHIMISLTVVVFAFHDPIYDQLEQWVAPSAPGSTVAAAVKPPRDSVDLATLLPVSKLVQTAQQHANGASVTELRLMLSGPRKTVRAALDAPKHYSRGARTGYLLLDPFSGKVQNAAMVPGAQPGYAAIVDLLFASHFGSYGGYGVKWLYFLLGISGALLFYSGNLLWLESRRSKQVQVRGYSAEGQPVRQPAKVVWLAALTTGISNGCLLGLAAVFLATKWLPALVNEVNSALLTLYYLTFGIVLGWTLLQGAAKTAVPQLKLCALLLFAVPLSSMLGPFLPGSGVWPTREIAEAMLDLTALLLSFLLFSGATLLQRRFRNAASDSIWYQGKRSLPDNNLPERNPDC